MRFTLFRYGDESVGDRTAIATGVTNADGRADGPILADQNYQCGAYALEFEVGAYHRASGQSPQNPFLNLVTLRFQISDASGHLHVPLLVSPFSYTTYRGS